MLEKIKLDTILFLDIETVPEEENFQNLDAERQYLYELKNAIPKKRGF